MSFLSICFFFSRSRLVDLVLVDLVERLHVCCPSLCASSGMFSLFCFVSARTPFVSFCALGGSLQVGLCTCVVRCSFALTWACALRVRLAVVLFVSFCVPASLCLFAYAFSCVQAVHSLLLLVRFRAFVCSGLHLFTYVSRSSLAPLAYAFSVFSHLLAVADRNPPRTSGNKDAHREEHTSPHRYAFFHLGSNSIKNSMF